MGTYESAPTFGAERRGSSENAQTLVAPWAASRLGVVPASAEGFPTPAREEGKVRAGQDASR
jgi:hypothetical protein